MNSAEYEVSKRIWQCIIQGVSGGIVNILGGSSMDPLYESAEHLWVTFRYYVNTAEYEVSKRIWKCIIQGVSGGIANILGASSMDYSE